MFEDSRKYGCFEGEILVEVLIEDEAGKLSFMNHNVQLKIACVQ